MFHINFYSIPEIGENEIYEDLKVTLPKTAISNQNISKIKSLKKNVLKKYHFPKSCVRPYWLGSHPHLPFSIAIAQNSINHEEAKRKVSYMTCTYTFPRFATDKHDIQLFLLMNHHTWIYIGHRTPPPPPPHTHTHTSSSNRSRRSVAVIYTGLAAAHLI